MVMERQRPMNHGNNRSTCYVSSWSTHCVDRKNKIMKKITKRLVIRHQTIRDLSLREVRGGAVVLDTEPCGTSIARGRCVAQN